MAEFEAAERLSHADRQAADLPLFTAASPPTPQCDVLGTALDAVDPDELSPRAVEIFSERGCDVDFKPGLKPAELRAIVGNYEGLAIRSANFSPCGLVAPDCRDVAGACAT